jgi:large subunit ribosomal protein L46
VSSSIEAAPPPLATSERLPRHDIRAGIILSRAPLLTRDLTPFESAFFLYQKRLNERLSAHFRRRFYFRPDTAADLDWIIKVRERRGTAARDIGEYHPRGPLGWNDELLVGSQVSSRKKILDTLLRDAEVRVSEDGERLSKDDRVPVEQPQPRRTEADEKNDVKRLDRALDRTLYFVIQDQEGKWGFPTVSLEMTERLHEVCDSSHSNLGPEWRIADHDYRLQQGLFLKRQELT